MPKTTEVTALAREFSLRLRSELSEAEMAEVIERNGAENSNKHCHSHDYCDANEVMDDAFTHVTGEGILEGASGMTTAKTELWGAAWDKAVGSDFNPSLGD